MQTITLQDQTYEVLREMIIKLDLYPGQKISESHLIELLKVGRTPIRESLKQLKKQNLIFTFPQSGTYVSRIDMSRALQARFIRECVEKEVMTELCGVMDEKSEKVLWKILDRQRETFKDNNVSDYFDVDNEFHKKCYELVGKAQVWQWIKEASVHLDRFRWLHLKDITFDYNQIVDEHEGLLKAVKSKQVDEVKTLVTAHINLMDEAQGEIIEKYSDFFSK
ncbi:GntR family transcriptional regulator [Alkalibacterium pelagium]|uniref:DNA-binding transcriptional regulator, GntR family n=1 Tax=Alkalibacterium pelagium TaxID=426702 RepID=A0A1H7LLB9_9LACT|nr:GntR family transcriptional regulator [Alkalibacterium pelagium]GEN50846.1 GntR family transcriptional regulator [Alkalibacterium pelagium]SEK99772.1 DNA-binding transcriptional regulator, GntR family [Alkalibacterium pelagium]